MSHRKACSLLPAYQDAVELQAPGATVDLQIDQRSRKFPSFFTAISLLVLTYMIYR